MLNQFSFHERLRQATSAEHRLAEQASDLLDPTMTVDGYADRLKKLYGFFQPMEAALGQAIVALGIDWVIGVRSNLILDDLNCLAIDWPAACRPSAAQPPFDLRRKTDLLGALYVVEGSALGARTIARHLQSELGLTEQSGASFFAEGGEPTVARWQRLLALLEAQAQSPADQQEIIESACRTFRRFVDAMTDPSAVTPQTPFNPA